MGKVMICEICGQRVGPSSTLECVNSLKGDCRCWHAHDISLTEAEQQLVEGYTAALSLMRDTSLANVHRVLNILQCRDLLRKARRIERAKGESGVTRIRTHPGEILREEYLRPEGMSDVDLANVLAVRYDIDRPQVLYVLAQMASVDDKMAEALAAELGTTKDFWLNLQRSHDESKRSPDHS